MLTVRGPLTAPESEARYGESQADRCQSSIVAGSRVMFCIRVGLDHSTRHGTIPTTGCVAGSVRVMSVAVATEVEVALHVWYANLQRPAEPPTLRDAESAFGQLRELFQLAYAFAHADEWKAPILRDLRRDSPYRQAPIPAVESVRVGSLEILAHIPEAFIAVSSAAGALTVLIKKVFTTDVEIKAKRAELQAAEEESSQTGRKLS